MALTTASGYDVYTTLASASEGQQQMASSALSSAIGFYQKKDYGKAVKEFSRAISLDPTNTQSYNFLANSYLKQNKVPEALKALKTSITMDPQQDQVHSTMANIYMSQKDYVKAEKEFKQVMKLNPTDTVAPYTLAQMYQQNGRYADAEKMFKQVSRMAPRDPNPYYALGAVYNKEGKYDEAVKQLTQAVRLRPKMTAAHFELGVAYAALGQSDKADAEVSTVTTLDATQGALLKATIAKPQMVAAGGGDTDTFMPALQTPSSSPKPGDNSYLLSLLDVVDLSAPNSAKQFSMTFFFDSAMDSNSVQDVNNWTINKASGGAAGYYNNLLPVLPTDAHIPQNPTSVTYDPDKRSATVTFLLSQNAAGNATIDSQHMVFKFSGKDVSGKTMDSKADEWAYANSTPF